MDNHKANKNLTIYTTGAFLKQRKINVDGKDYGFWIVEEFTDDSFLDGETCNPKKFTENKDGLLMKNSLE